MEAEAKVKKTYLTVPHEEGKLTFQYPGFKGSFWEVARLIDEAGLKRPNSTETISLIHYAFQNPQEKINSDIIRSISSSNFLEFTGNLYIPNERNEGKEEIILEDNPKITYQALHMNKDSLVKKLQEKDPLVRVVLCGFKRGIQTPSELSENPYILARYGEKGTEKLAEISSNYKEGVFLGVDECPPAYFTEEVFCVLGKDLQRDALRIDHCLFPSQRSSSVRGAEYVAFGIVEE